MMRRVILLLLLLLCRVAVGYADRTIAADKPIKVKLPLQQPCLLVFPETIADVKVGFGKEELAGGPNGPYLYMIARVEPLQGWLFVQGESGKIYTVDFEVGTPADRIVHITTTPPASKAATPGAFTAEALMRALYTSQALPGSAPAELPTPLIQDPRVMLLNASGVQVGGHVGQVLFVQNTQASGLFLDARIDSTEAARVDVVHLRTWTWPPMLTIRLIHADPQQLDPGQTARILVVYEKVP